MTDACKSTSPVTIDLNSAQKAAVQHIEGPLMILAGPGSGKTRVVTERIVNLIHHGVPPRQVVALTFTNKAADEMKKRLETRIQGDSIWAGTFHGFCARLLRQYASLVGLSENFSIYDTQDQKNALQDAVERANVDMYKERGGKLAAAISSAKNQLVTPDDFTSAPGDTVGFLTAQVYPYYQEVLRESNAVDFDDLLMHTAVLLRENPELRAALDDRFRFISVDEYQDTNFAQYAIVRALSINHPNLAVTGDPDQSIYGWRGACLSNILEFESDFPNVELIRLEQNYRSSQRILQVADTLIVNNRRRKPKKLFTENEPGEPVSLVSYPTVQDEAEDIADQVAQALATQDATASDFAIFYRVNAMSRNLEEAFHARRIPFQIVRGLEFYQRKEIKDVLSYLCLLNNPRHNVALLRIINTPARKIGKATVSKLQAYAVERELSYLEAARRCHLIEDIPKRSAGYVRSFVEMIDRMMACIHLPVSQLIETVLTETGYREMLYREDSEEADQRLENLDELVRAADEFSRRDDIDTSLESFLQTTALAADTDAWDAEVERVTLMSLHAAKGLEFTRVFIIGVEEGVLPHRRSMDSDEEIEEERRLFFVGITRARQHLQISRAMTRIQRGASWPTIASQFLMELPRGEMNVVGANIPELPTPSRGWRRRSPSQNEWDQRDPSEHSFGSSQMGHSAATTDPDDHSSAFESHAPRAAGPRVPVDRFHEGMLVSHPEFGTGTITSISGSGKKRSAEVEFYSGPPHTFVLAYSPLVPAEE